MKKFWSKVSVLLFVVSLLVGVGGTTAHAKTVTNSQYVTYLKNYSIADAKRGGVPSKYQQQAVADAKSQLTAYNKLSKSQKSFS